MVQHPEDGFFVSGNDARRKNYRVVRVHAQQPVIVHRDARKRRHRLGLAAAHQHHRFLRVEDFRVLRPDDDAVGNPQPAQRVGDLDVVHHAAARRNRLCGPLPRRCPSLAGCAESSLQSTRPHFPRRRAAQFFQPAPHRALGRRIAGALHVGAVAEQRQHALVPVARESMQIEGPPSIGVGSILKSPV